MTHGVAVAALAAVWLVLGAGAVVSYLRDAHLGPWRKENK